jgi:hypothetical protein
MRKVLKRSPRSVAPQILTFAILIALSVGFNNPDESTGLRYPVNMTISNDLLFVSDVLTGVHVFDVVNTSDPQYKMRIPLRSNQGTAVKDDILYANDGLSLLAIRIGDGTYDIVKELKRSYEGPTDGPTPMPWLEGPDRGYGCACARRDRLLASAPSPIASGGSSFATFAVIDDYLYYLDGTSLVTADISTADDPRIIGKARIGWDVETLYPTDGLLFVGGDLGMYIFDRSDPAEPEIIGGVRHFRACDPVVVSDKTAYVTLRGSGACGGARDVLLCVDVSNPADPDVIGEKLMLTPHGLAVSGNLLYVSNGGAGFELVDVSKPATPTALDAWPGRATRDFIWAGSTLYTLGPDNLMIFDVSTPDSPVLLSEIGGTEIP